MSLHRCVIFHEPSPIIFMTTVDVVPFLYGMSTTTLFQTKMIDLYADIQNLLSQHRPDLQDGQWHRPPE